MSINNKTDIHSRVERVKKSKLTQSSCFFIEVVLLDTTQETSLDWTRYPYGPQARTPGWVEESFTNFERGINWRSYVTCDVAYNNVNNWLWTPYIESRDANRMYIEIKFSMRDCNLFPGMALSCKETFSLLYYEMDSNETTLPPWEPDSYKLIDRIAADEGRFTSNTEVIINTEIRSVPITKKGLYFALRDEGACMSLISIKIYYLRCREKTVNLANFPATPTGRDLTAITDVTGQCVPNALPVGAGNSAPRLHCKSDGNWTLPNGECRCKMGYVQRGQACYQAKNPPTPPIITPTSIGLTNTGPVVGYRVPHGDLDLPDDLRKDLEGYESGSRNGAQDGGSNVPLIAGISTAIVLVIALVIASIVYYIKR